MKRNLYLLHGFSVYWFYAISIFFRLFSFFALVFRKLRFVLLYCSRINCVAVPVRCANVCDASMRVLQRAARAGRAVRAARAARCGARRSATCRRGWRRRRASSPARARPRCTTWPRRRRTTTLLPGTPLLSLTAIVNNHCTFNTTVYHW